MYFYIGNIKFNIELIHLFEVIRNNIIQNKEDISLENNDYYFN